LFLVVLVLTVSGLNVALVMVGSGVLALFLRSVLASLKRVKNLPFQSNHFKDF